MSTRGTDRTLDSYRWGWCAGCDTPKCKPKDSDYCDACAENAPLIGTVRRVRTMSANRFSRRGGR